MAEQRIHLGNFPEGLVLRGADQLNFSPKALRGGSNVDLSECLRTRDGCSIVSSGSLPPGTVRAVKQFRAPTNRTSKLIAQVDWLPEIFEQQVDDGAPRSQHFIAWDDANSRLLIFGGSAPLVAQYSPSVGGPWANIAGSQIIDTSTGYTCQGAVDSSGGKAFLWSIRGWVGAFTSGVNICSFDFASDTMSAHTCSGMTGTLPSGPGVFRSATGELAVFAPVSTSYGASYAVYKLNLSTYTWTQTGTSGVPTVSSGFVRAVYRTSDDCMYVYGCGTPSTEMWKYSFAGNTWTQLTSNNVLNAGWDDYANAVLIIGNRILSIWGCYGNTTEPYRVADVYDITANTWSALTIDGAPTQRFYHAACATTAGQIFIQGGRELDPANADISALWLMGDVFSGAVLTRQDKLFMSADDLPTNAAQFTPIYDLGEGAGTVSASVLNDRCVLTEGVNKVPLVYPGAESDDASDWAVPKAALSSLDGQNYYAVSPEVCDKDPDTIADVGQISPLGHIDICCDMPEVEGFYIEVKTPNTGGGVAPIYNQAQAITAEADVSQYDLKNTIACWHQDSGVYGHFLDGSSAAVTLGTGNTAPDVIVGTKIEFSDSTVAYIVAISGNGSGASGVTLSVAKATTTVNAIYGTDIQSNALTASCTYGQTSTNAFDQYADMTSRAALPVTTSFRQVIKGADITSTITDIQIQLYAGLQFQSGFISGYFGTLGVAKVSIVPRNGSTANGTTTPTAVTFNGNRGTNVQNNNGTITGGLSDVIPFTLTAGTDYVVSVDLYGTSGTWLAGLAPAAGHGGYYLTQSGTADDQTASVLTDYTSYGQVLGVARIKGTASNAAPQVIEVATTNSLSSIDVSGTTVNGVQVSGTTPADSSLWLALSFDGRATFEVFYSGAWQTIVKQVGGNWQYWTGSTFTNASANNVYQALRQAMAVAANQMDMAELAALTPDELQSTGGIIPNITQALDLAMGFKAGAQNALPTVTGWSAGVNIASTAAMQGHKNGAYTTGDGWVDGTAINGVTLAQTGIISYAGGTFTADYSVLNGVPGYWYRLGMNGTSAGTSITRILYKAPCQPLANIGDGQPSGPSGFIFVDTSKNNTLDFTDQVEDNVLTNFSVAALPMQTDDYLYIGFPYQFNAVEMTPTDKNQTQTADLSAEYWTGSSWTTLAIVDGTAGADGKTLSGTGKITWDIPSDWKMNIPFDKFLSRAYWVRFKVSAALSSTTEIAECRVYSVPTAIKKHRCVEVAGDRVFLAGRPDNENQVDVSGDLAEYLFNGDQSWSGNVGGQDAIVALTAAYDRLFVWKPGSVHMWNGKGFSGAEAAGRTPINGQCVVKATANGKTGVFFLNRSGAYAIHGLQADNTYSTAAISELSLQLNFWDASANPRLDLNYLHLACGEFWPKKGWIVWSVPMILGSATEQTTNNVLMIYDLILGCWYPLFTFPFGVASLCAAYTYNENAPQKLGDYVLLGGTYDGRIVRLFDPAATDDAGTAIDWYAETGWLHHGGATLEATVEKDLDAVWLFGTATGDVSLTTTSRSNYRQSLIEPTANTRVFSDLDGVTDQLGLSKEITMGRERGNYFKHRLSGSGPAQIYGWSLELLGERSE